MYSPVSSRKNQRPAAVIIGGKTALRGQAQNTTGAVAPCVRVPSQRSGPCRCALPWPGIAGGTSQRCTTGWQAESACGSREKHKEEVRGLSAWQSALSRTERYMRKASLFLRSGAVPPRSHAWRCAAWRACLGSDGAPDLLLLALARRHCDLPLLLVVVVNSRSVLQARQGHPISPRRKTAEPQRMANLIAISESASGRTPHARGCLAASPGCPSRCPARSPASGRYVSTGAPQASHTCTQPARVGGRGGGE